MAQQLQQMSADGDISCLLADGHAPRHAFHLGRQPADDVSTQAARRSPTLHHDGWESNDIYVHIHQIK